MFLVFLITLPLAILLFKLWNQHFDVYYFGLKGLVGAFSACWTAAVLIVVIPFLILQQFAIPIIIIVALVLIGSYASKKDKGTSNATSKTGADSQTKAPGKGASPYENLSDRQLILQFNQCSQERRGEFVPELLRRGYLKKDANGKFVQTGKQPT